MASSLVTSMRSGLMFRLTALVLLIAILPGCLAASWIEKTAEGEPKDTGYFALTASVNSYELTRWWGTGMDTYEALSLPRRDLPAGCESARFFLNDSAHELQIAQLAKENWITGVRPPLPDNSYPPCSLLVSYGSFSEPPSIEGVSITSATGLVTTSKRKQPSPATWALLPVGFVADIYIFIGALVTMPVWAPIGIMWEKNTAKKKLAAKEKEKGALPPPVAACWTTIDGVMKNSGASNADQSFVDFEWASGIENSYVLTPTDDFFSENNPAPIDARITLRKGRVQFRIKSKGSLWTDADVECGLRAGDVVATGVNLRK